MRRASWVGIVWLWAGLAHAQSTTSAILGQVRAETRAALAGAEVTARHLESGLVRSAISDDTGHFTLGALPVGTYEVHATLDRFRPLVRPGIRLVVGEPVVLNLTLVLGGAEDEITVTQEVSAVRTRSGELSYLVSAETIRDLPLNGRNYTDLAFLQPGVIAFPYREGGSVVAHGLAASVNGQDPRSNVYLLDGTLMNDFTNSPAGSAAGTTLGTETVREFRVEANAYGAEFGRNTGGQINVITKSGTNDFHGSVYEFHRNDALDARNYYDPVEKPDFRRNQFGFTLGGPVRRDRTFFFVGYEGLRESLGRTISTVVPNEAARGGVLPAPGGGTVVVPVSPSVRPYLDEFPLPNGEELGGGLAAYRFPFTQTIDQDYFQARLDQTLSGHDQLFLRYTYDRAEQYLPTDFPQFPRTFVSRNQFATAEYRRVFSARTLGTFRLGYSRTRIGQEVEANTSQPLSPFVPGRESLGAIDIGGVPRFGPQVSADVSIRQDVFAFHGDFLHTRGRHTLKSGVLVERYQSNETNPTFSRGIHSFANLEGFLRGRSLRFIGLTPEGDLERAWPHTLLGLYVQDEVSLTERLTLNAGLRYEYATLPRDEGNRDVNMPDLLAPQVTVGPLYENPTGKNVSPRLGVAWDVFGDGRTALRGGYGLYFNTMSHQNLIVTVTNPPATPRPVIPNPTFPVPDFSRLGALSIRPIQYDIELPRIHVWNVSLQRQLPGRVVATVGYAGTRGRSLWRNGDANVPVPETLRRRYPLPPRDRGPAERELLRDRAEDERRPVLVRRAHRGAAPGLERGARVPVLVHLLPQHRHDPGLDLLLRCDERDGVVVPGGGPARLQQGPRRLPREAQLGLQRDLGPAVRPRERGARPGPLRRLAGLRHRPGEERPAAHALRPGEPLALAVVAVARPRAGLRPPEPRPRAARRRAPSTARPSSGSTRPRSCCSRRAPTGTWAGAPSSGPASPCSISRSSSGCAGPASGRRASSSCAPRPSTSSTTRTSACPPCRRSRAPRTARPRCPPSAASGRPRRRRGRSSWGCGSGSSGNRPANRSGGSGRHGSTSATRHRTPTEADDDRSGPQP